MRAISSRRAPTAPLLTLTRGQETELPASAKVRFISSSGDYSQAVAEARRIAGASGRVSQADLPLVLDGSQAEVDRRDVAVRSLGGARAGELSRCRRACWRSSRPTWCASRMTATAGCFASPRSASTARATSKRAASIRRSTAVATGTERPVRLGAPVLSGRRWSSSSTCRCCAATSRPRPATRRRRKRRGPAASRCTARRRRRATR